MDRCYRPAAFPNDRARVEHLFALYERITAPLATAAGKAKRGRRRATTGGSGQNSGEP